MAWVQTHDLSHTTNNRWVVWGNNDALYEMRQFIPRESTMGFAQHIQQWFSSRQKSDPEFAKKLYPSFLERN